MTTLQAKTVTTRKRHTCTFCLRQIAAGERAGYYAGVPWNAGEFITAYTCAHCMAVLNYIWTTYAHELDPAEGVDPHGFLADQGSDRTLHEEDLYSGMLNRWCAPGSTELLPIP